MRILPTTPKPPYYAVIFTSIRNEPDPQYDLMADKMLHLAQQQPGFLAVESARNATGITVSYWQDLEAIHHWKQQTDHLLAQQLGQHHWYSAYSVRICKVERAYGFASNSTSCVK